MCNLLVFGLKKKLKNNFSVKLYKDLRQVSQEFFK